MLREVLRLERLLCRGAQDPLPNSHRTAKQLLMAYGHSGDIGWGHDEQSLHTENPFPQGVSWAFEERWEHKPCYLVGQNQTEPRTAG